MFARLSPQKCPSLFLLISLTILTFVRIIDARIPRSGGSVLHPSQNNMMFGKKSSPWKRFYDDEQILDSFSERELKNKIRKNEENKKEDEKKGMGVNRKEGRVESWKTKTRKEGRGEWKMRSGEDEGNYKMELPRFNSQSFF